MIWSHQQVWAMESYSFTAAVSKEQLWKAGWWDATEDDGPNPLMEAVLDRLFHGLREAGRTWALEIHKDDCAHSLDEDEELDLVRVTLRWQPATRAGLLVGGPAGGTVYHFGEDLHRRGIRVQTISHHHAGFWREGAAGDIMAPVVNDLYYEYRGWTEARRMWVYSVAA